MLFPLNGRSCYPPAPSRGRLGRGRGFDPGVSPVRRREALPFKLEQKAALRVNPERDTGL